MGALTMGWVNVVAIAAVAASPLPPAGARTAVELDALATLRYRSAQTETVAARIADAQLLAMRARIDGGDKQLARTRGQLAALRANARSDKARIATLEKQAGALVADLTALKNGFTEELARRDAQYARDIAILQTAGEQLLATPDGVRALALYNAGGAGAFEAADAVLAAVEAARDKAREAAARQQLAADRRSRAQLALDARDKGLTTTKVAIERWVAVVEADPSTHWDWMELAALYLDAGQFDRAQEAAGKAQATATNDRDRSVALLRIGEAALARGDVQTAATSYDEAMRLDRVRLAQNPGDGLAQRDLTDTLARSGKLKLARGDLTGASGDFEQMLKIRRGLAERNPDNPSIQRDLGVALDTLGDLRIQQRNIDGATALFDESLALARLLASKAPQSLEAQRDLSISLSKIAQIRIARNDIPGAIALMEEALAINRRLAATDATATAKHDAAYTLNALGLLRLAIKDLDGAAKAVTEMLDIARRQAAANPANPEAQRDLSVALERAGDVELARGDGAAAAKLLEEGVALRRAQLKTAPVSAPLQRQIALLLIKLASARHPADDAGAFAALDEALTIGRTLAKADAKSAEPQRVILGALWSLAQFGAPGHGWNQVVAQLEAMRTAGQSVPSDAGLLDMARGQAAASGK
ncbi:hypothetical protein [Sphingomonas bacterium]|uniref:hypothetical protein n=1 Tax=Sphingomonas bacterium TaxID=1895847 RepID=UPI00261D98ED|nr:hypothetical protein [Sphingomonas bacterium]